MAATTPISPTYPLAYTGSVVNDSVKYYFQQLRPISNMDAYIQNKVNIHNNDNAAHSYLTTKITIILDVSRTVDPLTNKYKYTFDANKVLAMCKKQHTQDCALFLRLDHTVMPVSSLYLTNGVSWLYCPTLKTTFNGNGQVEYRPPVSSSIYPSLIRIQMVDNLHGAANIHKFKDFPYEYSKGCNNKVSQAVLADSPDDYDSKNVRLVLMYHSRRERKYWRMLAGEREYKYGDVSQGWAVPMFGSIKGQVGARPLANTHLNIQTTIIKGRNTIEISEDDMLNKFCAVRSFPNTTRSGRNSTKKVGVAVFLYDYNDGKWKRASNIVGFEFHERSRYASYDASLYSNMTRFNEL
ncbi:MAG: hypothetical protein RSF40_04850 [Oscillospiraceae bacterium]